MIYLLYMRMEEFITPLLFIPFSLARVHSFPSYLCLLPRRTHRLTISVSSAYAGPRSHSKFRERMGSRKSREFLVCLDQESSNSLIAFTRIRGCYLRCSNKVVWRSFLVGVASVSAVPHCELWSPFHSALGDLVSLFIGASLTQR